MDALGLVSHATQKIALRLGCELRFEQEVFEAHDRGDGISELVGNACREPSYAGHPLAPNELRLSQRQSRRRVGELRHLHLQRLLFCNEGVRHRLNTVAERHELACAARRHP